MQKQVLYMQGWEQGTYKGHKQTTIRYCKPTEHASEGSVARVASDVSCRPDNFYKIVRIYIKIEGCLKIN